MMAPILECCWFRDENDPFFALTLNQVEVSIFADASIVKKVFGRYMECTHVAASSEDSDDESDENDVARPNDNEARPPRNRDATVTDPSSSAPHDSIRVGDAIWIALEIAFQDSGWQQAGQRLQELSSPLADAGVSILYTSTYTADFILIKESDLHVVTSILESKGFQFNEGESDGEPFIEPDLIRRLRVQQNLEPNMAGASTLSRANSGSRRSGGSSLAASLTLSDKGDQQQEARGRQPTAVMKPTLHLQTELEFALADSLALLPDELVQIGLASPETMWRTKIVEAMFFTERVLPPTQAQRRERAELRRAGLTTSQLLSAGAQSPVRVRGPHRSPSLSSSMHATRPAESSSTVESSYPAPYIALTQTSDGSSITCDVRLLRAIFTKEEEDQMVFVVGRGGLRGVWQGEDGVSDEELSSNEKEQEEVADGRQEATSGRTDEWEQIGKQELDEERRARKLEARRAGEGGRRLLKCLQLDLVDFGLDKTGIVDQVAGILAKAGINCVYQSTFSSANVLVAKCDIARARRALEAAHNADAAAHFAA
ncbi:hypothetical protein ACM66B_006565 [Microbotryomycetes sp. NB124-2]